MSVTTPNTPHETVDPVDDGLEKAVVKKWKAPIAFAVFVVISALLFFVARRDGVTELRLSA